MNVTHDIIAAVQGPGWKYGLSRILVNDQNEGVVFIAGQDEPWAFFTVTAVSTSRGTGTSEDGEITWRRRGSSCQYKLAKCKINTETMTQRWVDSLVVEEVTPAEIEEVITHMAAVASEVDLAVEEPKKAPAKKTAAKKVAVKEAPARKSGKTKAEEDLKDLL